LGKRIKFIPTWWVTPNEQSQFKIGVNAQLALLATVDLIPIIKFDHDE
jgi:hypothetical protein